MCGSYCCDEQALRSPACLPATTFTSSCARHCLAAGGNDICLPSWNERPDTACACRRTRSSSRWCCARRSAATRSTCWTPARPARRTRAAPAARPAAPTADGGFPRGGDGRLIIREEDAPAPAKAAKRKRRPGGGFDDRASDDSDFDDLRHIGGLERGYAQRQRQIGAHMLSTLLYPYCQQHEMPVDISSTVICWFFIVGRA